MFDNKQNLNSNITQKGQAPSNLPTNNSNSSVPQASEPIDILSDVEPSVPEPAAKSSSLGSTVNLGPKSSEVPPALSNNQPSISKEPLFSGKRKIIVSLIAVVALLILGGATWYGIQIFTKDSSLPSGNNVSSTKNPPLVNKNSNSNQNSGVNSNVPVVPPAPPVDTDRDGLTDKEEALYGTNPNVVDTDGDGLTDRDEVKVFETDPNNSDTDGDGYPDGTEVRAGYDPKGPGKLLKLN